MRNSLPRSIYHWYITQRHPELSFRGAWKLTSQYINDYKSRNTSLLNIARVHHKGWAWSDWSILGVDDATRHQYLSTLQYCLMHPFNGRYSAWIDDKLTLKYILHGTHCARYMPDYYWQIMENGDIQPLMDAPLHLPATPDGIITLLEERGHLALKLIQGSLGHGFYKATHTPDQGYTLNGTPLSRDQLRNSIASLRGYLVCECLLPHYEIARYNSRSVGCLRYLVGKRLSGQWERIYTSLRVGTQQSGHVENYNAGGVLMVIDSQGHYTSGNIIDFSTGKNLTITHHPDNHLPLQGQVPMWDAVEQASRDITDLLPQLTYLGFDFCITHDNRVKIIEINSLSSLTGFQKQGPILSLPQGAFYRERM